jgi:hypothetical protein
LIEYAYGLLEADHSQTLRQLHYAIFSRGEIAYENTQAHYKRLSRATTVARRAYRSRELLHYPDSLMPPHAIPPQWMVDETREAEMVSVLRDATAYVDTVKRAYRRDNWQDQPLRGVEREGYHPGRHPPGCGSVGRHAAGLPRLQ